MNANHRNESQGVVVMSVGLSDEQHWRPKVTFQGLGKRGKLKKILKFKLNKGFLLFVIIIYIYIYIYIYI
jgi:hypothetical protein